jgi:hypothetical protein
MDETTIVDCPHCGASNELFVDTARRRTRRIEDCQVCSESIDLRVEFEGGSLMINALAA